MKSSNTNKLDSTNSNPKRQYGGMNSCEKYLRLIDLRSPANKLDARTKALILALSQTNRVYSVSLSDSQLLSLSDLT